MVSKLKNIGLLLFFIGAALIFGYYLDSKHEPMVFLTAGLIGVTAYYAWTTYSQLEYARHSTMAAIRPLIIATRFSERGEIGAYAGEEGINREISLINVGSGHAHKVNIRLSPPAEAYARAEDNTIRREGAINVIHGVEIPKDSKRMWNNSGAFCSSNNWHFMYAEYEDTENNEYYTIQSGYNVKTGRINELRQSNRKNDNDPFWTNAIRDNWLDDIDVSLKEWAIQQKNTYETRTGRA
jgi:hypothetical protein